MFTRTVLTCAAVLLIAGASQARTSPYDGRLEINNDRAYPVTLKIDGEPFGRVAARTRRVVPDVPNGVRFIEIGCKIAGTEQQKVEVPVRGLGRLRVAPFTGRAEVYNNSGVRMKLSVDGQHPVMVRSGQRFESPPLKAGIHTFVMTPARSTYAGGAPMKQTVRITAGREVPVRFGTYLGSLTVRNPSRRGARLLIDGQLVDRIAAGASRTFTRQVPGTHVVSLERRGRTIARTRLTIAPGERARWVPQPPAVRDGDLLVRNGAGEYVTILLDGREVTCLRAGERETIRDVRRGAHTVTVVYENGRRVDHRVDVDSSQETFATRPQARPARYAWAR